MPVLIFFAFLDLKRKSSFMDRHILTCFVSCLFFITMDRPAVGGGATDISHPYLSATFELFIRLGAGTL